VERRDHWPGKHLRLEQAPPDYAPVGVVNGSGQGSGHRVNQTLPTPESEVLPTPDRSTVRKRGGWIEFREKNGRRYARRRSWKKVDGQWRKIFEGRETTIPVMTEKEYEYYVAQREQAKRIRAGR
jgi:hypothetical protein